MGRAGPPGQIRETRGKRGGVFCVDAEPNADGASPCQQPPGASLCPSGETGRSDQGPIVALVSRSPVVCRLPTQKRGNWISVAAMTSCVSGPAASLPVGHRLDSLSISALRNTGALLNMLSRLRALKASGAPNCCLWLVVRRSSCLAPPTGPAERAIGGGEAICA